MKDSKGSSWGTKREIDWLDHLGKHRPEQFRPGVVKPRETLLRQYLDTMPLRDRWGQIDPLTVECWIRMELRNGS